MDWKSRYDAPFKVGEIVCHEADSNHKYKILAARKNNRGKWFFDVETEKGEFTYEDNPEKCFKKVEQ